MLRTSTESFAPQRKLMAVALALGLALCLVVIAPARHAYALGVGETFKVNGNRYVIDDYDPSDNEGEVTLVSYNAKSKKPSVNTVTYKGMAFEVETIGKNAFNTKRGRAITSVTIGRHVNYIGSKAFYRCSKLKTINLRKSDVVDLEYEYGEWVLDDLEIAKNAFKSTGVKKVKVLCGSKKSGYQAAYKKALVSRRLRKDAVVAK